MVMRLVPACSFALHGDLSRSSERSVSRDGDGDGWNYTRDECNP